MTLQPDWKLANTKWWVRVYVWSRMSLSEDNIQISKGLELEGYQMDRKTVGKVRRELPLIPAEVALITPDTVQQLWKDLKAQESAKHLQPRVPNKKGWATGIGVRVAGAKLRARSGMVGYPVVIKVGTDSA